MIIITNETNLPGSEQCFAIYLNANYIVETNTGTKLNLDEIAERLSISVNLPIKRIEIDTASVAEFIKNVYDREHDDELPIKDALEDWNANDIEDYLKHKYYK